MEVNKVYTEHSQELLLIQKDLSILLASTSNLEEAFKKILEVLCQISPFDSGGIYLPDEITGDLSLKVWKELSSEFIKKVSFVKKSDIQHLSLEKGIPVYNQAGKYDIFRDLTVSEGLHAICIVPVLYEKKLIALLNLASHKYDDVSDNIRHIIETIASQIGSVIIRLKNDKLLKESQQNLQMLFDTMDDFLIISDLKGNVLHFNPSLERRSGYPSEELLSMNLSDLFKEHEEFISPLVSKGKSIFHISLMTKKGAFIPVETKINKGTWNNRPALFSISRDMTDRIRFEDSIKHRLSIEELVTDISTAFINITSSEIDREINISLEKMGKFFDVDRAFLTIFSEDNRIIKSGYEWASLQVNPLREKFNNLSLYKMPWLMNKLGHFDYIDFSSTSNLPPEAFNEIKLFNDFGVKSGLVIPIIQNNFLTGWIGFNMGYRERSWQEEDIKLLRMAGEIFMTLLNRKGAEEALKKSETEKITVLETLPECVYFYDREMKIKWANRAACKENIVNPEEVIGHYCYEVFYHKTEPCKDCYITKTLQTGEIQQTELTDMKGHVWLSTISPVFDEYGIITGVIETTLDITERKRAEKELIKYRTQLEKLVDKRTAELKKLLEEKEILLKEIHHRVKNNLQLISSLLYLQSHSINDKTVMDMLLESQNRIKSIGLVHEKLYQSENFARIDFKRYIYDLSSYLFSSYRININIVLLNINVGDMYLNINKAIPCGLIINELLTNALKHAFPPGSKGEISIKFYRENDNKCILEIRDNGKGLPEGLNIETSSSLGLKLVKNLAKQIDGELYLSGEEGTAFKIIFPS